MAFQDIPTRKIELHLKLEDPVVRKARRFVQDTIADWNVEVEQDSIQLITSELVTNSLRYAPSPIELEVSLFSNNVRISVWDSSPRLPVKLNVSPGALGGRGLEIVDVLSSSWGSTPKGLGKQVWAEVPLIPFSVSQEGKDDSMSFASRHHLYDSA